MSQKILVPIDGSKQSLKALEFAIETSQKTNDQFILLNVQPKIDHFDPKGRYSEEEIESLNEQKGFEVLKEASKIVEKAGIKYDMIVRTGLPTIEITNEAKKKNIRCIVMGTRGMGPDVSKALGSVSYGVLHLAPCPITLVPYDK